VVAKATAHLTAPVRPASQQLLPLACVGAFQPPGASTSPHFRGRGLQAVRLVQSIGLCPQSFQMPAVELFRRAEKDCPAPPSSAHHLRSAALAVAGALSLAYYEMCGGQRGEQQW